MRRITSLALAAVTVLALAACSQQEPEISTEDQVPADQRQAAPAGEREDEGAGDASGGSGDAVTFQAADLSLEGPAEVPAGAVTIELANAGNLPHDITIEELGDRTVVETDGGGTATGTVELEPGTYTFYCSVPGHRSSMELTVEVTG